MLKLNIVDMEVGLKGLADASLNPKDYGMELLIFFSGGSKTKMLRIKNSPSNQSDIEGGFIWKQKLHYAPAEKGKADDVLAVLKSSKRTAKHKTRLLIVNDGETLLVFDVKYQELTSSTVNGIHEHAHLFYPLIDVEIPRQTAESPIDIKATAKLAKLYDALVEKNPDWLEGERRHDFNHFMTQIIFCLFAEDTGILPLDIFSKTLKTRAGQQGEYATDVIRDIFNVLDRPDRESVAPWLKEFPYVNGGLFKGEALVPEFTRKAYRYLMEAAQLDWKDINPDILGSSIQAIVDPSMRGNLGMHYTRPNLIVSVLSGLFLDEYRNELMAARNSKKKLEEFLEKLRKTIICDSACGSGNFLVIAYRELRKLEMDALDALRDLNQGASMQFGFGSVISLSNFYGIEYADFAAETAKLALWIAEYQQNRRFEAAFGGQIPALPLKSAGNILCANALRVNWEDFVPRDEGKHVYLCGNPPYLGASSPDMTKEQKDDMDLVFKGRIKSYRTLDYVCAWFLKAVEFCASMRNIEFAFVSTNTIVQGVHVPTLWPYLFNKGMEISYAHTSFKWSNLAANNAGVTCVIVGMRNISTKPKYIFSNNEPKLVDNINGYLLDAENILIQKTSKPISSIPSMDYGQKPADGGNLILSLDEKEQLEAEYDGAQQFIRGFVGSQEFIKGTKRYCLWIDDDLASDAAKIPFIQERLSKVRTMRLASTKKATRDMAEHPHAFGERRQIKASLTVVIPRVSSELRPYLPCGILTKGEIISDRNFGIYDGPLWTIALLASKLHLVWIATVCVRLEERFSYSNTLGWNTFPVPELTDDQKAQLEQSARKIILTREEHLGATIADLYDPKKMPDDLRKAHQENDALLESFYRDTPFKDDDERLAHLFERYVEMTTKH
mgnify:CR=1 FL=1